MGVRAECGEATREGEKVTGESGEVSNTTEYKVSVAQFLLYSEFCADN